MKATPHAILLHTRGSYIETIFMSTVVHALFV